MAINTISSNPILNNPTFQRTQTRETTHDPAMGSQGRADQAASGSSSTPEEGVSLNLGSQALRPERALESRPTISPREAERTANSLRQMMNDNPQQTAQAFGVPDSRMVQSLLAAA